MLSALIRLRDFPVAGEKIKASIIDEHSPRLFPKPDEGDNIYHTLCQFEHRRRVTERELTDSQSSKLQNVISDHMRYSGKKQFINDQSANVQRIRQITAIFAEAKFIHVIRDGRNVAYEILHRRWWSDCDIWWYGHSPRFWQENGGEPIVLCGLHWKHVVETILEHFRSYNDHYLEVRYEDLVSNTRSVMHDVLDFCGLEWSVPYAKFIPQQIQGQNEQSQRVLTPRQQTLLNRELRDLLAQLRYR
jgi:hypothetical protein